MTALSFMFHQMKKDIRHFGFLLCLWFVVIVTKWTFVVSGMGTTPGDVPMQMIFGIQSFLIPLLQLLLLCIVIPMLIHEEPLVGTDAFWLTRPIPRRTLMMSKLLFLLLFLILPPLIAELLVMAGNGVTAQSIVRAVPEILLERATYLMIILTVAVLTPNFARFALVGGTSVVTLLILLLIIAVIGTVLGNQMEVVLPPPVRDQTDTVVFWALTISSCLWVVATQYLQRRTKKSVVIAAIGVALTCLATASWPWHFLREAEPNLTKAGVNPIAITLSADETNVSSAPNAYSYQRKGNPQRDIVSPIKVKGLPSRSYPEPIGVRARLEFPDGARFEGMSASRFGGRQQPALVALQQAIGRARLVNGDAMTNDMSAVLISVDDSVYARYGKEAGNYYGDFEFDVKRCEPVADTALSVGARYDRASHHIVITQVLSRTHGCTLILKESYVNLVFGEKANLEATYVLRANKRNEAFSLWETPLRSGWFSPLPITVESHGGERFDIRYVQLSSPDYARPQEPQVNIDEGWLAEASLVRVETVYAGRFSKSLHILGFKMSR